MLIISAVYCLCLFQFKWTMKQLPDFGPSMANTYPRHAASDEVKRSMFQWLEVYDRYMSWIFMSYVSICLCRKLAGLPGLPATPWSCTPDLRANFLSFGNRETTNTRLGAAKVPQPSVDLIYMAASACSYSLARSVCTAKFDVPTLTCCVLVWNGGGGFNKHLCNLITGINNRGQLVQHLDSCHLRCRTSRTMSYVGQHDIVGRTYDIVCHIARTTSHVRY